MHTGLPTCFSCGLSKFSCKVLYRDCGSRGFLLALGSFGLSFGSLSVCIMRASLISCGKDCLKSWSAVICSGTFCLSVGYRALSLDSRLKSDWEMILSGRLVGDIGA